MKTINEQKRNDIFQAILENISAFENDYPVQNANNGISTTDDANAMIAQYIINDFNNNQDLGNIDFNEYKETVIDAFYKHLELKDSDFDETGTTLEWLSSEVERYIKEYSKP